MKGEIFADASEWARNPEWSEKYKNINFVPPKKIAEIAAKGLELRKRYGKGGLSAKEASELGIGSGVVRATSLKNQQKLSPETINRMVSFFARHEGYQPKKPDPNKPTAAEISWMLWGGDEGREWANKIKDQMEKADVVKFEEFSTPSRNNKKTWNYSESPLDWNFSKSSRDDRIKELIQLGIVKTPKQEQRLLNLSEPEFCKVCEIALTKYREKKILSLNSPEEKQSIRQVTKISKIEKEGEGEGKLLLTDALSQLYANCASAKGEKGQSIYPPRIAAKYRDYLATGATAVNKVSVSWKEVEDIWNNLSNRVKKSLCRKGKPPTGVPRGIKRGKQILKHLIEIGFRDEVTGQPYSWRDLQPDHKRPVFMFSEPSECEKPSNIIMVHKGFNGLKGFYEREVFLRNLDAKEGLAFVKKKLIDEYAKQALMSEEEFENLLKEKRSKASTRRERENQLLDNSKMWDKKTWFSHIIGADCNELKTLLRCVRSIEKDRFGKTIPIRFICTSMNRGGNYEYSAVPVNKLVLLLKFQIPESTWPHGVLDRALRQIKVEVENSKERSQMQSSIGQQEKYEQKYKNRIMDFLGDAPIPSEVRELFYDLGIS